MFSAFSYIIHRYMAYNIIKIVIDGQVKYLPNNNKKIKYSDYLKSGYPIEHLTFSNATREWLTWHMQATS